MPIDFPQCSEYTRYHLYTENGGLVALDTTRFLARLCTL